MTTVQNLACIAFHPETLDVQGLTQVAEKFLNVQIIYLVYRLNLIGGPPGCLQYYTGDTGTINTFGWQSVASKTFQYEPNVYT